MPAQFAVIMSSPTVDLLTLGCAMLAEIPGLPPTGRTRMLQLSAMFRALKSHPLAYAGDDDAGKGDALIAAQLSEWQLPMPLPIDEIAVTFTRLDGSPLNDNRPAECVAFGAAALDRALREAGRVMPPGGWPFVQSSQKGDKAAFLDTVRKVRTVVARRDVGAATGSE